MINFVHLRQNHIGNVLWCMILVKNDEKFIVITRPLVSGAHMSGALSAALNSTSAT